MSLDTSLMIAGIGVQALPVLHRASSFVGLIHGSIRSWFAGDWVGLPSIFVTALLAAAATWGSSAAWAQPAPYGPTYSCVDGGMRRNPEQLLPDCADRPPSREERADAFRRNRNLVARFPNEAAHNRAREGALDEIRNLTRISDDRKEAEIAIVNKLYDDELARLRKLWAGEWPKEPAPSPPNGNDSPGQSGRFQRV